MISGWMIQKEKHKKTEALWEEEKKQKHFHILCCLPSAAASSLWNIRSVKCSLSGSNNSKWDESTAYIFPLFNCSDLSQTAVYHLSLVLIKNGLVTV